MKTVNYLDAVKDKLNLPSDYALSKMLGITRESVSALRNGKNCMSIETAIKVADFLGTDGHKVYADGQIERAKSAAQAMFWKDISEKFSASFRNRLSGWNPRRYTLLAR